MKIGPNKQKGAATLIISLVLLVAISIFSFMSVQYAVTEQKVYSNNFNTRQAQTAAAAGIDYSTRYLKANKAIIIVDANADGYIDANSHSQTLSDGSSFTIIYNNPIPNDFDYIRAVSTGVSADASSTKSNAKLVTFNLPLHYIPDVSLSVKGGLSMVGTSALTNTETDVTVWSGASANFKGASGTYTSSGKSSSAKSKRPDVLDGDASLSSLTSEEFFINFFGKGQAETKSSAGLVVTEAGPGGIAANLDGAVGQFIWAEHTKGNAVHLSGKTVVGSPTEPVLLVLNGDLFLSGQTTIYGVLFVVGDLALTGGSYLDGAIMVFGQASMAGTSDIEYDSSLVDIAQKSNGSYAPVPTSWNDLGF